MQVVVMKLFNLINFTDLVIWCIHGMTMLISRSLVTFEFDFIHCFRVDPEALTPSYAKFCRERVNLRALSEPQSCLNNSANQHDACQKQQQMTLINTTAKGD